MLRNFLQCTALQRLQSMTYTGSCETLTPRCLDSPIINCSTRHCKLLESIIGFIVLHYHEREGTAARLDSGYHGVPTLLDRPDLARPSATTHDDDALKKLTP